MVTKINCNLPNFFLVGAAKSGTTSLYNYLKQHPEIFMPSLKEPKYISSSAKTFPHTGPGDIYADRRMVMKWDDYKDIYQDALNEKAIGDASIDNLYYYHVAIPNIRKICAKPKILIILRNPVDRAFSAYSHMVKLNREKFSFETGIKKEKERKEQNYEFIWHYTGLGFYYKQVKAYIDEFGSNSVKILLYENLKNDSLDTIQKLYNFLEVDENFTPDITRKYNISKIPKSGRFQNLISKENLLKRILRPFFLSIIGFNNTENLVNYIEKINIKTINPLTRRNLTELFREDIINLQELIDRDLSDWINY